MHVDDPSGVRLGKRRVGQHFRGAHFDDGRIGLAFDVRARRERDVVPDDLVAFPGAGEQKAVTTLVVVRNVGPAMRGRIPSDFVILYELTLRREPLHRVRDRSLVDIPTVRIHRVRRRRDVGRGTPRAPDAARPRSDHELHRGKVRLVYHRNRRALNLRRSIRGDRGGN